MWLELVALDADGNRIYQEGVVADGAVEDSQANPHPFIMRDYIRDETGNEVHMFWDAAMQPSGADVKTIPPASLRLLRRAATPFRTRTSARARPTANINCVCVCDRWASTCCKNLVNSGHLDPSVIARMPTYTMATKVVVTIRPPVSTELQTSGDSDCTEYLCLLDPTTSVGGVTCHDYLCSLDPATPGCS